MGRTPIRARDWIGFVANRCARPFTLEALRMLGEGVATHEEIDRICRLGGGFRMGPFELMDLIGDRRQLRRRAVVSTSSRSASRAGARTRSRRGWSPRAGSAARAGAASTSTSRRVRTASAIPTSMPSARSSMATSSSGSPGRRPRPCSSGSGRRSRTRPASRSARGSPRAEDIDTAMRLGFNWPLGPLEWGERLGWSRCLGALEELRELHGEAYRPARSCAGSPVATPTRL